ncbi:hypothetical protein CUV01_01050 [Paracoccus tegillarcae]|uniref:Uncharacterized protein n=1 Tax=Paracoccus tegillarcae TaxID=1529068 RepID=A0A2K9ESJ6_9RHOB|nr:hypothetical protein CUV01_01050 [Paracoccus tegillarcae]
MIIFFLFRPRGTRPEEMVIVVFATVNNKFSAPAPQEFGATAHIACAVRAGTLRAPAAPRESPCNRSNCRYKAASFRRFAKPMQPLVAGRGRLDTRR